MPIQNSFLFTCVTLRTVSPERYSGSKLSPGTLTTPESICLVLLRSRPDTVHRVSPRETQTSTPLTRGSFAKESPPCNITPTIADCRYKVPLTPRLHVLLVYRISVDISIIFLNFLTFFVTVQPPNEQLDTAPARK